VDPGPRRAPARRAPVACPARSGRLPGALRSPAVAPELIADPDRPDRDIGSVLVRRKYLSRGALQAILYSIIVDAALTGRPGPPIRDGPERRRLRLSAAQTAR